MKHNLLLGFSLVFFLCACTKESNEDMTVQHLQSKALSFEERVLNIVKDSPEEFIEFFSDESFELNSKSQTELTELFEAEGLSVNEFRDNIIEAKKQIESKNKISTKRLTWACYNVTNPFARQLEYVLPSSPYYNVYVIIFYYYNNLYNCNASAKVNTECIPGAQTSTFHVESLELRSDASSQVLETGAGRNGYENLQNLQNVNYDFNANTGESYKFVYEVKHARRLPGGVQSLRYYYMNVWIDYNNDGYYDTETETVVHKEHQLIWANPNASSSLLNSTNFVIPDNAVKNTPLEMRVTIAFSVDRQSLMTPVTLIHTNQILHPEGHQGEFEDYYIILH